MFPFPVSPLPLFTPEKLVRNFYKLLVLSGSKMAKRPSIPRPVAVKEVLQDLLNPGDREALELRQGVRRVWERVVPPAMREHACLVDLRRKELWVEVSESIWGQELQFLKPRILEELERALGPGKVRDLRLRVGTP